MASYNLEWLFDTGSSPILSEKLTLLERDNHRIGSTPVPFPVVEIDTVSELNMLVCECREQAEGKVVFRGQQNIYSPTPLPTAYRQNSSAPNFSKGAIALARSLSSTLPPDPSIEFDILNFFDEKLNDKTYIHAFLASAKGVPWYALEGLVQQYLGGTRWLDVVDSLWIAIWMATRDYSTSGTRLHHNIELQKRQVTPVPLEGKGKVDFVYLYFLDCGKEKELAPGFAEADGRQLLDLRTALPAKFLRPHSQHAMLMRFLEPSAKESSPLAIAKISSQLAKSIIGESSLLTTASIFPNPNDDIGFGDIIYTLSRYAGVSAKPSWRLEMEDLPPIYV